MRSSSIPFGNMPDGSQCTLFHFENDHQTSFDITDYGATVVALKTPGNNGEVSDIITGYAGWQQWLANEAYFGATIGRHCNRIGNARFVIDGTEYKVTANHRRHQLHGGFVGFNKKRWSTEVVETENAAGVRMTLFSPHMDEGFPGNLEVQATYMLDSDDRLTMEFSAQTDAPTPVNMTNHCYFNLGGHGSGTIYDHQLVINADFITETDSMSIPTGNLLPVAGTPFDFREPHTMGERMSQLEAGYDDNFALRNQNGQLAEAARIYCSRTGRLMVIHTTEPGIQFYTANWFDNIPGKEGRFYNQHEAFALETQHFPDSVNHDNFPEVILRPGKQYYSKTCWQFSIGQGITR